MEALHMGRSTTRGAKFYLFDAWYWYFRYLIDEYVVIVHGIGGIFQLPYWYEAQIKCLRSA